jgi:protein SCO1/2
MWRSALALVFVLPLLAVGCGGGGTSEPPAFRGLTVEGPEAPNFSLTDQHGRRISLAAQRGRWAIVSFLYTQCPDVCPAIAGNLNAALRTTPGRKAGLTILVVSVDPKRDTPPAVSRYARAHRLGPRFHYLIGSRSQLERVWRAYQIAVLPGPKGTIAHSATQLLIDPEGRPRLVYDSTIQTADVVHDLRLLEEEG